MSNSPERQSTDPGPQAGAPAAVLSLISVYAGDGTQAMATLRSLLGQSFQAWEWVIAGQDDPATRRALGALAAIDRRVRPVFGDQPAALARSAAQADARLDIAAGDVLDATALERRAWAIATRDRVAEQPGGLLDLYSAIQDDPPFANRLPDRADRRRILILTPWLRTGGADRFVLDLARGLTARGDRVSIALLRGDVAHTWRDQALEITSDVFNLAEFVPLADYPRFLRYLIESRNITHVVVANSLLGYQLLPYLRAHCPASAYLDYLHNEEQWRAGGMPRASLDHRKLLDLQITSSAQLRQWMIERGGEAERIAICTTNSIPQGWQATPALRAAAREALGIPPDAAVVVFAGRLVAQKRVRLAAEIVRRTRAAGSPLLWLVAGDGSDTGWLRRFVRRHRLQNSVRLLGQVPHQRLREVLLASDVLLLPSAYEGIALILYEALALGVVPLAADVGGQRELVTPECGILVAPQSGELEAYVAALERLLADRSLRESMSASGQARVQQHFHPQQMIERMDALLDQATHNATALPRLPIDTGVGHAAASLAIEHTQLEQRLRSFSPIRALLALRQSSAWPVVERLLGVIRKARQL
jgi:glycosyltransferase involved in cell wall biosynthesis